MKRYIDELNSLELKGQMRQLRNSADYSELINLSSNDYLGIGATLSESSNKYDSACSSRLLTGNSDLYFQLENTIETQYGKPSLFFNSGYHINIGILPAVTNKQDLILSDKLNHASIIDGLVLSNANIVRYRHNDLYQLEQILEKRRDDYDNVFIVTESIFSMDGDKSDLKRLVELKNKYNCFLYVDEAHAVGVFGEKGLGLSEELNLIPQIDFIVGTFGKAYASIGAYVVCNDVFKKYLINKSRSLIYTTALPDNVIAQNISNFTKVLNMSEQRNDLRKVSHRLRSEFIKKGIKSLGDSNIVPVIVGENKIAVELAEHLQKLGYWVFAIRPPTVPQNSSRLRISVCANTSWESIQELPNIIFDFISKY
ncbi:MAG: 8-amino-7-oxononanoate synthase [Marinifilaceae bacterium]|jgi:8-amino-7-oxononanoate synthase|nr:8-amino-7-oxononanoate synthase [Marinifilaceae bacterium]